jgi:hypothetical protein
MQNLQKMIQVLSIFWSLAESYVSNFLREQHGESFTYKRQEKQEFTIRRFATHDE